MPFQFGFKRTKKVELSVSSPEVVTEKVVAPEVVTEKVVAPEVVTEKVVAPEVVKKKVLTMTRSEQMKAEQAEYMKNRRKVKDNLPQVSQEVVIPEITKTSE